MARDTEIFGLDRRKAIVTGLAAIVLVVGLVAIVGQVTSFHDMLRALRRGDESWFPVCLAGELLAYAGYIVAYRDAARVDVQSEKQGPPSTRATSR